MSSPFPREDNDDIAKIDSQNLKIFFSRITGKFQPKLAQSLPGKWNSNFYTYETFNSYIRDTVFPFLINVMV